MTQHIGKTQQLPIDQLEYYHQNPRRGNLDAIVDSLKVNGQYRPIVVNRGSKTGREWEVLAGNHTLMGARFLDEQGVSGWREIDCYVVDVDDEHASRIVLADNRTSDLAEYDDVALISLLESLDDLAGTGFAESDVDELKDLIAVVEDEDESLDDTDEVVPTTGEAQTQLGDVVELGRHRVLCADCGDTERVLSKLMFDGKADCVWTDPPYGVNYVGATKKKLSIKNDHREGLSELLERGFSTVIAASVPGAPVYIAHADKERFIFETAMRDSGLIFRQNLVWVKNSLCLGRADYQYRHEPILYGFTPGAKGRLGRGSNHWYGGNSETTVFEFDKPNRNADHPTMKPVALVKAMLKNSCPSRGTVLDIFAGGGSTLIAAHQLGMTARVTEIDPQYVDVISRRYQKATGEMPVVNGTPMSFTEG